MDAVVLAAGNGTRLKGLVAAGMKPLLVVDGEALVARLVRQAQQGLFVHRTIVVVSPINAQAVCDVIENNPDIYKGEVRYVVQSEARGPGDALRLGLELARPPVTLVLLGDNIMPDNDVARFREADTVAVGTRTFKPGDEELVAKLTRIRPGPTTVEKVPVAEADLWEDRRYRTWYGPLLVHTEMARERLETVPVADGEELFIGPYIPDFGPDMKLIPVDAHDVGYV